MVEPTLIGNGSIWILLWTSNDPLYLRFNPYFSLPTTGWWMVLWIHLWASLFWPTLSGNHNGWRMVRENISLNLSIPSQFGNHCHWFKDGSLYISEPSYSPLRSGIHLWLKDDSIWIHHFKPPYSSPHSLAVWFCEYISEPSYSPLQSGNHFCWEMVLWIISEPFYPSTVW